MFDSLRITASHTGNDELSAACPLCGLGPVAFAYRFTAGTHVDHTFKAVQGECCVSCAESFIRAMDDVGTAEMRHWYWASITAQ